MDYGSLIRRSWHLTWRRRFLWMLGLFATTTVGSCTPLSSGNAAQARGNFPNLESYYTPDLGQAFLNADPFVSHNIALMLLGVVSLVVLFLLVFSVVSVIAQGGMAEATIGLALGQRQSGTAAWGAGVHLAWRYFRLWLLLIVVGLLVAMVLVVVVGIVVALAALSQGATQMLVTIVGGLLGLVLIIVAVLGFVALSVIVAFAQRAIPLERAGPWTALRIGYRLVRRDLGRSAVAWVISLALSIAAGIVIVAGGALLLVPLAALGFWIYSVGGISSTLVFYGVAAALALLAWIWFLGGMANAFFWNYWTMTYLYLTDRLTPQMEPRAQG